MWDESSRSQIACKSLRKATRIQNSLKDNVIPCADSNLRKVSYIFFHRFAQNDLDGEKEILRKRFVANIPQLLWSCRREALTLIALLSSDRAIVGENDTSQVSEVLKWLALLAKRQQTAKNVVQVGCGRVVSKICSKLHRQTC